MESAESKLSIEPFTFVGENPGGTTHRFALNGTDEMMTGIRKAGTVFGRHYHKGISPFKNPERFVLLAGRLRLRTIDVQTREETEREVAAPAIIVLWPWLWHELEALEEVRFVEMNGLEEHARDTFYDFIP